MTGIASTLAALLAGGAVAVSGLLAGDTDGSASRTALVVDAAAGRDGRELVDARLREANAEIRLPRTSAEASTDVRYLAAQGYRVVVSGPLSLAAAGAAGIPVMSAPDLDGALAAAGR